MQWSEKGLVVIKNNIAILLDQNVGEANEVSVDEREADDIILYPINVVPNITRSVIVESGSVNVSFISNAASPDVAGDSLCWAACAASIINFYTGSNYSAVGLYNVLKIYYPPTTYGYPNSSFLEKGQG